MILVTGASGFIGVALTKRLARDRNEPVVALLPRLGTPGAARLATIRGVRLVRADVRDEAALTEAMRGCRAVIHCAVDSRGSTKTQRQTTTLGARATLEAAHRNKVEKLIFLSTAAVHPWTKPGIWNEDAPVVVRSLYTRAKLEAEKLLVNNGRVPVLIVRPTCVYGPFAPTWTVALVQYLRLGIPLVASDNSGRANVIYIDNLVDLILAALDARPGPDRIYLANDDEPVEWTALLSAYAETLGLPLHRYACSDGALACVRDEVSVSLDNLGLLLRAAGASAKSSVTAGLRNLHRHVPLVHRVGVLVPRRGFERLARLVTSDANAGGAGSTDAVPPFRRFASAAIREFYGGQARFSAERAKRELGWRPRVPAGRAIANTCAWIRYARI